MNYVLVASVVINFSYETINCAQSSMFTCLLLSTDWTEFDATALFERCQDGEWFRVCPHAKAHQLLISNSHTHTGDSPHPFAYATSTQVKTGTIEPFVSYGKNQRQTEHWLCIGELCFPCKRKIFSATKCCVFISDKVTIKCCKWKTRRYIWLAFEIWINSNLNRNSK